MVSRACVVLFSRHAEQDVNGKFHIQKKLPEKSGSLLSRGGQIRTDDLLVPNQARYRATLHPEIFFNLDSYLRPWRQSATRYRATLRPEQF